MYKWNSLNVPRKLDAMRFHRLSLLIAWEYCDSELRSTIHGSGKEAPRAPLTGRGHGRAGRGW